MKTLIEWVLALELGNALTLDHQTNIRVGKRMRLDCGIRFANDMSVDTTRLMMQKTQNGMFCEWKIVRS